MSEKKLDARGKFLGCKGALLINMRALSTKSSALFTTANKVHLIQGIIVNQVLRKSVNHSI